MRWLLGIMLMMVGLAGPAWAGADHQPFVSIAFHAVVDQPADLETDAVTTRTFVQFLDWLKAQGWTPVSLDDLSDAAAGRRKLPAKAILLTFDDARESLYSRVFPLLKAYHYPAVAAVVGVWMDEAPGTVPKGDDVASPPDSITWAQAREMQASGLIEFASHGYDLHHADLANPHGGETPATVTWRYDRRSGQYEDDAHYAARIRADLKRSMALLEAHLGRRPRAIAWPYGRYTGLALDIARELGLAFSFDLEPEPSDAADLSAIHRYYPSGDPGLGDIVRNLRFDAPGPRTLRIACLTLDALAASADGAAQDAALGRMIEGLRALGVNTVIIDANARLASPKSPLGEVYFPTSLRPWRADILGRATWQIRTRAGADVFLRLPLARAEAAVGEANVPRLFADMLRYSRPDGITLDLPTPAGSAVAADRPEEIRDRRSALNAGRLDSRTALGLAAYRAAAGIDPRLRLMLEEVQPGGPPDWADIALLPPSRDAEEVGALASRLRANGWLQPNVAGRVAFSLPADPVQRLNALRVAQRQGASAFALCPDAPALPPAATLSAVFSAVTYPHRP
ncbi:poly-beta-1,6-N-acetyl-D-glucosamine N-deacetylase PgaB [Phenylobacterium sp.]|uniref:poly-beta-1,6-N-acetyl-D-glucosamine N-deacetylase PgaB n=1 Tax=Phenylobacterium sp. TaxID=1871053 RepID=UPI002F3EC8B4